jgi:hypothetical protein
MECYITTGPVPFNSNSTWFRASAIPAMGIPPTKAGNFGLQVETESIGHPLEPYPFSRDLCFPPSPSGRRLG